MTKEQILALIDAIKKGNLDYIKELVKDNPDCLISIVENKHQLYAIHYASKYGQLEIVQYLLEKNPGLLNLTDVNNQTPLLWAAAHGQVSTVKYLIDANANIDIATNTPGSISHGRKPLDWAMLGSHYKVVNLLILKTIDHQNKDAITPFIKTGVQALELMLQKPSLTDIMLQDDRIVSLIQQQPCSITPQSISWYKLRGRRPSWFLHIDREAKTSSLYEPVKELGSGTFGRVRLFQSPEGQKIAVKSLLQNFKNISKYEHNCQTREIFRETAFNNIAYPGNISEGFEFVYEEEGQRIYTNRCIMPYVNGVTASNFLPKISCEYQLAEIILQIAQELQRIHDVGIIHGDVQPSNIMISSVNNQFTVRFIDFGGSSFTIDDSATIWECGDNETWISPELVERKVGYVKPKPNPNQDVYSLGYSLKIMLHRHSSREKLIKSFPSISSFITASQNLNPEDRPSLKPFCQQLIREQIDVLESNVTQVENKKKHHINRNSSYRHGIFKLFSKNRLSSVERDYAINSGLFKSTHQ